MKVETRVGIFVTIAIGIFFYLSLNIGAIRLDERQHYTYKTYFDDTGGLDEKSPIKIAGVEVGWVEAINLLETGKAEVILRIHKRNKLARNAYATIQQVGLIGSKNIDIEPGDPATGTLAPGSVLAIPGRPPTTTGDLLEQFKEIATNMNDVVVSFKNTFGTRQGEENLRVALNSVSQASEKIASLSEVLDRTLHKNEQNINEMIVDFKQTSHEFKGAIPSVKNDFHSVSNYLNESLMPSFKTGADKITVAMADDALPNFSKASSNAGDAFVKVGDSAEQVKGTFKEAEGVVEKLNSGKGLLGKMISDEEVYDDLKGTVKGFKQMVGKAQTIDILIDMHSENLFKTDNNKGYLSVKLRPLEDYFYNIQLIGSEHGRVRKKTNYYKRYDSHGNLLSTDDIGEGVGDTQYYRMDMADQKDTIEHIKNDILFGFQFGKRFNRVALRIGMFESSFGAAVDYYVPLRNDYFHWITTVEAFDFNGANRIDSERPHVKWLNQVYFMRNVYTAFGMDDICSKKDASPFFGGGIRFGDDDIKYLLSYFPAGKLGSG